MTIEVFSDSGEKTGETVLDLGAGQRISKLLPELIPESAGQARGYIVIRSTQGLIAQQLFGDFNLTLLSAVPPTVIR